MGWGLGCGWEEDEGVFQAKELAVQRFGGKSTQAKFELFTMAGVECDWWCWEDGLGSHHEFRLYLKDNGEKHHQIHLLEISYQVENGSERMSGDLHCWPQCSLSPASTPLPWPPSEPRTLSTAWLWARPSNLFWPVAGGRSSRVPFLSPGIKKPWLFPLALWYLCLCQVRGAQEEDGRQMEHSHPAAAAWSTASSAALQTPKRGMTLFVFMRCWNFQYAVLLWLLLGKGHARSRVMY